MKVGDKVRLKRGLLAPERFAFFGIVLTETYIVDDVFMSEDGTLKEVIVITGNRENAINATFYSCFFELVKSVGFIIE
jgi:hypothetical protein